MDGIGVGNKGRPRLSTDAPQDRIRRSRFAVGILAGLDIDNRRSRAGCGGIRARRDPRFEPHRGGKLRGLVGHALDLFEQLHLFGQFRVGVRTTRFRFGYRDAEIDALVTLTGRSTRNGHHGSQVGLIRVGIVI